MEHESELKDTPITLLSDEGRRKLSYSLNTKKCLLSEGPQKLPRDWTGLASLLNIPSQITRSIENYPDRIAKVLELWPQGTIGQLLEFIEIIDRYDVYDDLLELAEKGCLVRSHSGNGQVAIWEPQDQSGVSNLITEHDKEMQAPQEYHAFILFADKDWPFVEEMLVRLRAANLKVCTSRDVMPYFATQHAPITRLITERCHKIILIISPEFFESPVNKYYVETALSMVIEKNIPKVIPCMVRDYSELELPVEIKMYHKLFYNHPGQKATYNFWDRLILTLSHVKIGESTVNLSLPQRSDPVKSASMNNINTITVTAVTDDSKSLSSVSQISATSDVPKKKGTLRSIKNFLKPKKHKKAVCLAQN